MAIPVKSTRFPDLETEYTNLWKTMKIRDEWVDRINDATSGIIGDKTIYSAVQSATGVPWFVVGILHQMESTRNFKTHLHNGDPLSRPTINVPAGRPTTHRAPFTWEESAIDAIRFAKIDQTPSFSLEHVAYLFEGFNGFRSRNEHDIFTPYLWSGTEHYVKGKFVRDNVFDDNAVSQQVGCMPILARLVELDDSVEAELAVSTLPKFPPATAGSGEMDLKELQDQLKKLNFYVDAVDGLFGPNTRKAIRALLVQEGVLDWTGWRDDRLFIAGQQAILKREGVQVGDIDGILGPITTWALGRYADFKQGKITHNELVNFRDNEDKAFPPTPSPIIRPPAATVWPTQDDVRKGKSLFGERGVDGRPYRRLRKLILPYPLRLSWDLSITVRSTSCHEEVHDFAKRALENVLAAYGFAEIQRLRLDLYGGCFNVRPIRGGKDFSMHSWGIAFDFDTARNGLNTHNKAINGHKKSNPPPAFADPVYDKWFKAWEDEGAISLGHERDYDWMHVQFARLA